MARTKALGGWLKQSKGKEKDRKVSGTTKQRDNVSVEIAAWRFRGGLWYTTLAMALAGYAAGEILPLLNRPQGLMYIRYLWVSTAFPHFTCQTGPARDRAIVCNVDVLGSDLCGIPQSQGPRSRRPSSWQERIYCMHSLFSEDDLCSLLADSADVRLVVQAGHIYSSSDIIFPPASRLPPHIA